jgi:molecular chaperone GrpE
MKKIPVTESASTNEPSPQTSASGPKASPGTARSPQSEPEEDEKLQADLDRFRDLALRSQADFENYKKRAAREKEEGIKYANNALIERLLPIVDNFELGLEAARSEGEKSPVFSGMSMVHRQLMDFLAEHGVQPIEATGQKFDPNLHEAITHEPSKEFPEGVVIRQTRRGYRMKDRLLRPSSVAVASGKAV